MVENRTPVKEAYFFADRRARFYYAELFPTIEPTWGSKVIPLLPLEHIPALVAFAYERGLVSISIDVPERVDSKLRGEEKRSLTAEEAKEIEDALTGPAKDAFSEYLDGRFKR